MFKKQRVRKYDPLKILTFGFLIIALIGALLLMLPVSNRDGRSIPFINALFTSVSSLCVTGLAVYDTWSQFTYFGQTVMLILIQTGGLGFMSIAFSVSIMLRRKINIRERGVLMESAGGEEIGGTVKLFRRILLVTFACETLGAALLSIRFIPAFGTGLGIWFSVFHSVSAFCNAGFDLCGIRQPYSSLNTFAGDPLVNITVMLLIIVGGLGFLVWDDVITKKFHFSKYSLQSKIMLSGTAVLVLGAAAALFCCEYNCAFRGMPLYEKILAAFFQAVTPRTAGFNTVDMSSLSNTGQMIVMVLMFIGAGPGSTAGGIKITAVAVVMASIHANMRKLDDSQIFSRRLRKNTIKRAYDNIMLYSMILAAGIFLVSLFQHQPVSDIIFECISAMSTVGLSMGITRDLVVASKAVLISLMYAGRVGSMTMFTALLANKKTGSFRYPPEPVIV
jgi:trk system potassium uptake protein TrkH